MYIFSFFFFNDTATTEIYTLSLHDALPISLLQQCLTVMLRKAWVLQCGGLDEALPMSGWLAAEIDRKLKSAAQEKPDRKSTRLNSSHTVISYAVFCLKKKKRIMNSSQE